jgi:hypothetical protein
MKQDYLKKAEILTKYFGIYGIGHFNLSHEEIAEMLKLIYTKDGDYLNEKLKVLYERLHELRMGETP